MTSMDTTVITVTPADFGLGESDRVTMVDSEYTVDSSTGDLHVFRKGHGNIASFPKDHWRAVIRGGSIAFNGTQVTT